MENQDKIVVYDEFNNPKECKVLAVIQNKYIVYTDINNKDYSSNLLASKFDEFSKDLTLHPLDNVDWIIVEEEYKKICDSILTGKEV